MDLGDWEWMELNAMGQNVLVHTEDIERFIEDQAFSPLRRMTWLLPYFIPLLLAVSSTGNMGPNKTLFEARMRTFMCPVYTHDDAKAKFST
jgi:hypothetical protein